MTDMAIQFCETLPAEPLSVADVVALKKKVYPDIDPILGLQPEPMEDVILLHVTDGSTMSYLGVEAGGWEILVQFSIEAYSSIQAAVEANMDTAMEWAETYYSSKTFALLDRVN